MAFSAQTDQDTDIPVKRIALFSSGVGFFEHSGKLAGSATLPLPFSVEALNDVLKSLIVHDPGTKSPLLTYPSEETLERTLKSLKIDLSGNPGLPQILAHLRGAELEVISSEKITGRILGVESRTLRDRDGFMREEAFLSLSTKSGIRMIALSEISSFNFTDSKIGQDLNRALDLILSSRDDKTRNLFLHLPGDTNREVSFAYVIPAPVWKVSYRLDLSRQNPLLQGWAIVENVGDTDWENVELSLVTGRPVSFIQNLYQPYHLSRPVIPLSIAGYAEATTFDSGYETLESEIAFSMADEMPRKVMMRSMAKAAAPDAIPMGSNSYETATGSAVGDQFSFTVKRPVNLPRQQSAMIPMVEAKLEARKLSVFSGAKAFSGQNSHPSLCAELVNTTGMKLPAGPITVFDGGTYAGDALIEFLPEKEKRLIAFGEDLSVTGSMGASSRQEISKVLISKGAMILSRKNIYGKKYTFKNASTTDRKLMVEHPFIQNAKLSKPAKYDEKTGSLYRFTMALAAGKEMVFEVLEEMIVTENISLTQMNLNTLLSYSRNKEIPANVRTAFETAMGLKRAVDSDEAHLKRIQTRRDDKITNQDRIRKNLEAAGNTTSQGKEYLKRLAEEDQAIDQMELEIEAAKKKLEASKKAYEKYLMEL
ncbi:DUF4139 domain-containing protein, partial [Desulfococcaceae bacterium OttesenSCG-928-F15]|nr:DUF4139 domain-containing protein [Desulfococcaceae bacterium OttesenSCG-928-F15]